MMINLKYGGMFKPEDLVDYVRASGRDYIIQGQQACSLTKHKKPHSLYYWLRQYALNHNTKQAENAVMAALVATGYFTVDEGCYAQIQGHIAKG